MPDFSTEAVNYFWCDYDKRTLYRIVASMQKAENWTVDDHKPIDTGYMVLGNLLEENPKAEIKHLDQLIRVMVNSKSARSLRLMQHLDSVQPGMASKILMYAEENTKDVAPAAKDLYSDLFLKRNLVFERLQLLSRIFSAERMNLAVRALESCDDV